MGGEGEFLLLGLGCQESECRHSGIKSSQILSNYLGPVVTFSNCPGMQLQFPGLANVVKSLEIVLLARDILAIYRYLFIYSFIIIIIIIII